MRGVLSGMVLVVLLLASDIAEATWVSGSQNGTVSAGAVIADTGALAANYNTVFSVTVDSSVSTVFRVQRRNSSNTTTIQEIWITVNAGAFTYKGDPNGITVESGERLRVVVDQTVIGRASASIEHSATPQ